MILMSTQEYRDCKMPNLSFSAMHLVINDESPSEDMLSKIFTNARSVPFKHGKIDYSLDLSNIGDGLYWMYARYGKQHPYVDTVLNKDTESIEKNPKTEKQVELNHQFFVMYDAVAKDFYLSNTQKASAIEAFIGKSHNCIAILKSFLKTPEEFFNEVGVISKARLVSKTDLFNQTGNNFGIEPDPVNIFGFDAPSKWDLTAHYDNKKPTKEFINKITNIFNNRQNGSVEKLICQGYSDGGIEKIFNIDSFTHKLELTGCRQSNEVYDEDEVLPELASLIKEKRRNG